MDRPTDTWKIILRFCPPSKAERRNMATGPIKYIGSYRRGWQQCLSTKVRGWSFDLLEWTTASFDGFLQLYEMLREFQKYGPWTMMMRTHARRLAKNSRKPGHWRHRSPRLYNVGLDMIDTMLMYNQVTLLTHAEFVIHIATNLHQIAIKLTLISTIWYFPIPCSIICANKVLIFRWKLHIHWTTDFYMHCFTVTIPFFVGIYDTLIPYDRSWASCGNWNI